MPLWKKDLLKLKYIHHCVEQVTHAAPDVDQHQHHEQNLGEDRDEDLHE